MSLSSELPTTGIIALPAEYPIEIEIDEKGRAVAVISKKDPDPQCGTKGAKK